MSPTATRQEVEDALNQLRKELPPYKNFSSPHAAEKLEAVTTAYRILGNPISRASYDLELRAASHRLEASRESEKESESKGENQCEDESGFNGKKKSIKVRGWMGSIFSRVHATL